MPALFVCRIFRKKVCLESQTRICSYLHDLNPCPLGVKFKIPKRINMKILSHILIILLISSSPIHAQIPQGIKPGNGDDAVSIWESPLYIIAVVVLLAFVILGFWIRRKK